MTRFVIGIGSQRAGSTLLHTVLRRCTSVAMHPVKELHYFDAASGIVPMELLRSIVAQQAARGAGRRWPRPVARAAWSVGIRTLGDRDVAAWLAQASTVERLTSCASPDDVSRIDYRSLYWPLSTANPLLGEVTPEYMLLEPAWIDRLAADVGSDARIILMRRDPVRRIISSYVMTSVAMQRKRGEELRVEPLGLLVALQQRNAWAERQFRFSDYDSALARYRARFAHVMALDLDDLATGSADVADRLESFLGTAVDRVALADTVGSRVNAGAIEPDVDRHVEDEVRAAFDEWLRDQRQSATG